MYSTSYLSSSYNYNDPSVFTQYKISKSIDNITKELQHHHRNPNVLRFRNSSSFSNYFNSIKQTGSSHHFSYVTNNQKLLRNSVSKASRNVSRITDTIMKATMNEKLENEIFQKVFKDKDRDPPIDNKFNLFYAENEGQYIYNMKKQNEQLEKKGKATRAIRKNVEYINSKLTQIKDKISFLGGVTNYCYPGIILYKIAQISKSLRIQKLKRKNHSQSFLRPFEQVDNQLKERNLMKTMYINQAISMSSSKSYKTENANQFKLKTKKIKNKAFRKSSSILI